GAATSAAPGTKGDLELPGHAPEQAASARRRWLFRRPHLDRANVFRDVPAVDQNRFGTDRMDRLPVSPTRSLTKTEDVADTSRSGRRCPRRGERQLTLTGKGDAKIGRASCRERV